MSSFLETPRLADSISFWATGGRGFMTTIVETYGGDEYRNSAWAQARGEYDFAEALRNPSANSAYNFLQLRNQMLVCRGRLYGFRMRDWNDYKCAADSNDGLGTVTAIDATHWQMYKTYTMSPLAYSQIIQKPQTAGGDSPGVVVAGGGSYTVDYTTGIITKVSGASPTGWTGYFDIPVRFAKDARKLGPTENGALLNFSSFGVVEIRNPG